ncbi:MAG: leucine-rich repeat domain-containing protein [Kofleriaceae bacterium]|nr:leucine-rich repeat domain-containing protein [Kofleriaceae bacterium]
MPTISYQDALKSDDKNSVSAIEAPSGDLRRIGEFPNLTSLSLSGNFFVCQFTFLREVPKLEKLYLTNMGLKEIPGEIAQLPALNTLFVGQNEIRDFSVLGEMPKIVDLNLEKMNLKKVPDVVTKISGLKSLGLYDNDITSLSSLKKLKKLERLFVASNRFKKLPKEFAKLPLRELHIVRNFALEDYEVLGELTELESLSISNSTDVHSTPASVFTLKKLKALTILPMYNAGSAGIDGLENIGELEDLEELVIVGSPIREVPAGICKLQRLRILNLKDNKSLTSIENLHDLPLLEELDLSSCDLREIGEAFSTLKSLKKLDLSRNKTLENIDGLRDLPALESLQLYSKLKALPASLGTLTGLKSLRLSAKADGVDFIASLTELEELYIADCAFAGLPATLTKLKTLTVYREEESSDTYLEAYPKLVELRVNQPSFTLPNLPQLESLSIGRIKTKLDVSTIGTCTHLTSLSLHRSDGVTKIPSEFGAAKSVTKLDLSFLKMLTDVSAVGGLTALEEFKLSYARKLESLPKELGELGALRTLTLDSLDVITDIGVVGELSELRSLHIDSLDELTVLPQSLAKLTKLKSVELRSSKKLTDISVLEKVPNLDTFTAEYCKGLKRKSLGAVEKAIEARQNTHTELSMSYLQFMEGGAYKALEGKEDAQNSYPFPLCFGTVGDLLSMIEDFSWTDDVRDDEDHASNGILTDSASELKPLAVLDFGWEGCDTNNIDAYCEEIFLVDTASAKNAVFLWGHDGSPEKIHDTFDVFLASLQDFSIDEANDEVVNATRTYLEFIDGKSEKFWQIVVTGSQYEVTYGKIGKNGSSKTKEFASTEAAQKDADKLIASKKKKGYAEKAYYEFK